MIEKVTDFISDSPLIKERARGFNKYYLQSTGNIKVNDFFKVLKGNLKIKELLKAALDLRVLLKEKGVSAKELQEGTFFQDSRKFSQLSDLDVLLWAAHCSKVISLNPNEPFIQFGKCEFGEYIGLRWIRDDTVSRNNTLATFGACDISRSLGYSNNYFIGDVNVEQFFTAKFNDYGLYLTFKDGYCLLSLQKFIDRCASCMFLEDSGSSNSILTLLKSLQPSIIPDVVDFYIQYTMKPPVKTLVDQEKAKYDMVYHQLNLSYDMLSTLDLMNTDVKKYLNSQGLKHTDRDKLTLYANNLTSEKNNYYID